ncbi:MAG TPA: IS3 family transposase [Candidatus Limnocylindrales bacterium]|nr:IS3 family transposase [Candidatus Limnocylindrales bacterium]
MAENLLDRNFNSCGPNKCWVSDISYIYSTEGWLYLAAVMDLYSRRIIGWVMEKRLTKDLMTKALKMAIGNRRPGSSLLMRSDRGSQYASHEYQKLLQKQGMICSMSKKRNCYDNAVMESFFTYLKS